tara:strand:- start:158 stop:1594 length:1437 start_codon:yes stop_codon:yes gene_type:complete
MEVLQRTANRGSISTAAYEIDNSISFDKNTNESLYRTPSSSGNQRTFTFSAWVKFSHINTGVSDWSTLYSAGDYTSTGPSFRIGHHTNNSLQVSFYTNSAYTGYYRTDALFRDCSAWYHFVCAIDTTQATNTNRVKIYVNGEQASTDSVVSHISQNYDTGVNTGIQHELGLFTNGGNPTAVASEYIAETHLIDGQALAPTEFGEVDSDTGIWIPKKYTGSYGTNGVYLDYADAGDLGDDESGNGNDYTEYNMDASDQATDTPTNNFCTLNPNVNFKYGTNAGGMINGATVYGDDTGGGVGGAFGTFGVTAGKWYWEMKLSQQVSHYPGISAVDDGANVLVTSDPHEVNSTFNYNISAARREYFNSGTRTYGSLDEFGDFHTPGDIIAIALNMDDNQISIYCNGTLQSGIANSSIFDAANKMVVPFHGTINDEVQYNFGGYSAWTPSSAATDANGYGTFEYAPPTGYYALCTKNLAEYG